VTSTERLAALTAAFVRDDAERLLALVDGSTDVAVRAAALARASRVARLATLRAACATPLPSSTAVGRLAATERGAVRRLAEQLLAHDAVNADPRPGPATVRRLLLRRLCE
jgi:hypothetical protein